ncbi:MAG: VWA domain-containing protein, partial [Treponema sp.]|nr:VWA domain-containing protein [Treponema sp.]
MKKALAVFFLILGIIFSAAAQTSGPANLSGPMDLILLYDTSASMSDYYKETADYLTGPFLKDFLRVGDTFHLISFSKTSRLEISRLVEGVGDVETIIGRILLMYPIDPESDIPGA